MRAKVGWRVTKKEIFRKSLFTHETNGMNGVRTCFLSIQVHHTMFFFNTKQWCLTGMKVFPEQVV